MNDQNMTTKVLCFDTPKKAETFAKYMENCKTAEVYYTYNTDDALRKMLRQRPDIVLLGGELESKDLKAAALYHMMEEWELHKRTSIYITTWNVKEAEILKSMSKKSMYVPMCESVADLVKERSRQIRVLKKKKLRQNSSSSPNSPE